MIEIRELIIKARVEEAPDNNDRDNERNIDVSDNKENCEENLNMILKIIKDKKER